MVQEWTQARRLLAASLKVVTWREKNLGGGESVETMLYIPHPLSHPEDVWKAKKNIPMTLNFWSFYLNQNGRRGKENSFRQWHHWERKGCLPTKAIWLNAAEPVSIIQLSS